MTLWLCWGNMRTPRLRMCGHVLATLHTSDLPLDSQFHCDRVRTWVAGWWVGAWRSCVGGLPLGDSGCLAVELVAEQSEVLKVNATVLATT